MTLGEVRHASDEGFAVLDMVDANTAWLELFGVSEISGLSGHSMAHIPARV